MAALAPALPPAAPTPMAATTPAATVAITAAASNGLPNGLPQAQAYTLPLDELQRIAASSGLQWVNSDSDKIAAVQAAIATEPTPIHVPRERPASTQQDEAPLVLVETRRDLSTMALPFEPPPAA